MAAIVTRLKRAVRTLLRPFARPMLRPILRRIDEVNELAVRLDRHLPIIENAIQSQNAELRSRARSEANVRAELDRLGEELAHTRRQVEELRQAATPTPPVDPPPAIRLARLRPGDELRLHFTCGAESRSGYVNVDVAALPGADLAANLRDLPFDEGSVVAIRASLVLERFSVAELRRVVLPRWRSLLAPGGELVVLAGDAEANLADYQAGRLTFEQLAALSFGAQEDGQAPLHSMLSGEVITRLLAEAGFGSIETHARQRLNDASNRVEVRAARGDQGQLPMEAASRTSSRG